MWRDALFDNEIVRPNHKAEPWLAEFGEKSVSEVTKSNKKTWPIEGLEKFCFLLKRSPRTREVFKPREVRLCLIGSNNYLVLKKKDMNLPRVDLNLQKKR